jgi:heavy metal efflux system protein
LELDPHERQKLVDEITHTGASKMMHSAFFGQLIIIIVFIPILSLVGVEGKMFRPMALAFSFALIGAMILCFTYVPVMASLFIKPSDPDKKTVSSFLITAIQNKYRPTLSWALDRKKTVLGIALVLLLSAGFLLSRMGGEFVPTLDEGDFVIQPVLKVGTSLSETAKATTRIEGILKRFPEVDQVVSRIGAAEVPTDPMSMEESDVIIKLKPKGEWVTAGSKDELAEKFKEALAEIPGVDFEFTQPIEMRFNELITGVRADLAIKIFGEDLDLLYKKALEVQKAVAKIEGAADITVEKIVGLPQMSIQYDRQKIAKHGLNVEDLNNIVSAGFAGMTAGTVFEGEKQFDLVVRFDKKHHQDIEDIETATIQLPNGNQIPFSELAVITYSKGPAKISRENTKRRIVVGVNVRNRDLESVVKDVEAIIEKDIKLPTGYTIEYGGQFENLRTAKERLMIAVPIALLLIFVLLYFAFNSVKDALIIYSAIPMSAIGGIALLYLRDMPFSISAGVGFIALFGIAVLNGIVLIEEFKELKAHGISDINTRILTGTKNRLRPVLLTASAAALGFLPMALSTSAGAEVQRPLATVVVGGLISATALTLIVLPVLYALFDRKRRLPKATSYMKIPTLLVLLAAPVFAFGQDQKISASQAIEIALRNNLGIKASSLRVEQSSQLQRSAIDIEKTEVYFNRDNNNIAPNNLPLNVWGISQSLQFPTVYAAQRKVLDGQYQLAMDQLGIDQYLIAKEVSKAYYEIVFWKKMLENYTYLDSIYGVFDYAAKRRFDQGASNYLEKLTAETKKKEVSLQLNQIKESLGKSYILLNHWLQSDTSFAVADDELQRIEVLPLDTNNHPELRFSGDVIRQSELQYLLQKQQSLPDINLSVFQGINNGGGTESFAGFQVGLAVPLFFGSQKAKVNAAKTSTYIKAAESDHLKRQLASKYLALLSDLKRLEESLLFYESTGKKLSEETLFHATRSYENGEIDFLQHLQLLENAKWLELNYLSSLFQYNMTALEANYLMHQP